MIAKFNRLILLSASAAGLLIGLGDRANAQTQSTPASLTGTWTMSLIGDHVIPIGLALQQNGTVLTGTLTMMGKDIPLKGELKDNALTLSGSATMMMRDHATPSGGGDAAAAPTPAPMAMKFTGTVLEDGTLSGEMAAPRGPMKWTADRLKERPVAKAASPTATGAGGSIVGSWNLSVIADHVTPVGLAVEGVGEKVKGTMTLMGTDVALTGTYVAGTLALSGEFGADVTAKTGMSGAVKVSAKMKEDGTLAGEFAMARGTFPLTGERLKDRGTKASTTR